MWSTKESLAIKQERKANRVSFDFTLRRKNNFNTSFGISERDTTDSNQDAKTILGVALIKLMEVSLKIQLEYVTTKMLSLLDTHHWGKVMS